MQVQYAHYEAAFKAIAAVLHHSSTNKQRQYAVAFGGVLQWPM